jgi:hypothetical protein
MMRSSFVRVLVGCALLTESFAVAFARDDDKTYRCMTKDAVSIREDGSLNREIGKAALETFDKMVINVSSGEVTYPSAGKREQWVVERASQANAIEYVLYPTAASRRGETVANAVTHFIRLREVDQQQLRFMLVTLSYIVTGTCSRL